MKKVLRVLFDGIIVNEVNQKMWNNVGEKTNEKV